MPILDFVNILIWWFVFLVITIAVYPITSYIFANFIDRGYIFAKILGILLLSYLIYVLGTLRLVPFTFTTTLGILLFLGLINFIFLWKKQLKLIASKYQLSIILIEELLFFIILLAWSYVRGHQPAIEGLEKLMDYGFVKSILNSRFFPPQDMWLSPVNPEVSKGPIPEMLQGFYINYYYFGHLVTAVLTRLSTLQSAVTYNLQIATLAALTFTGSFSLGVNLLGIKTLESESEKIPSRNFKKLILAGILTAFLVAFSGNLHTIYSLADNTNYQVTENTNPVPFWQLPFMPKKSNYWYPNATRFIPFTIHEFPAYSFIVSDLHGHVSDIPFVLLIIAVLLNMTIKKAYFNTENKLKKTKTEIRNLEFKDLLKHFSGFRFSFSLILIALLLATFYMTNAWDTLIYGLLVFGTLLIITLFEMGINRDNLSKRVKNYLLIFLKNFLLPLLLIGFFFILFSLPFSQFFHPFSSKIGVNCGYELMEILKIAKTQPNLSVEAKALEIGPLIFEPDKCQKTPLWMHLILWGFFYYIITGFIAFIIWPKLKNNKKIASPQTFFIAIMILLSIFLLWIPEFFYIKDIYPAHFRANTMFKLGYQAFIMLSLVAGYTIKYLISDKKTTTNYFGRKIVYLILLVPQLILVSVYPAFGTNSYYNNLKQYEGIYGLNWLKNRYPQDYNAVVWLDGQTNKLCGNDCPVILEAVGDSYTAYARVSANTGLPTVLGWPVHEWLWRGSYDEAGKRRSEVETIYTANNLPQVLDLIKKYNVEYLFVGQLEREKYPLLTESIFKQIGEIVYQKEGVRIYKVK